MGAEKQLKISVSPDEVSFRKAKLLVDDLTRSIEKLAKASTGIGGSGVLGVTAGNRTLMGLGPNTGSGGRPNQPTGVVSQILGGDAGSVRTLVTGTQQAFNQVGTGIRTFIERATNDVQRLTRSIQELQRASGGVGGGGGGGGGTIPGMGPVNPYGPTMMAGPGGGTMPGHAQHAPPGGGGGGPSWWNQPLPGSAGFRQWAGGRASAAANFLGLPPQAAASIGRFASANAVGAGLGAGMIGAYEFGAKAFEGTRGAQLGFALDEPFARTSRAATIASMGHSLYGAARGGDVSQVAAWAKTVQNRDLMRALGSGELQKEQALLQTGLGPSFGGMARGAWDTVKQKAGGLFGAGAQLMSGLQSGTFLGGTAGGLAGGPGGDLGRASGMSELDIKLQRNLMDSQAEQASRFQTAVHATQMLTDPEWQMEANSYYSGAMGNVALRRHGYYGVPKGQDATVYMKEREARLRAQGYDPGAEAGARNAIVAGAGMGYLQGGLSGTEVLGLQGGGAQNVVGTAALAGRLGGGVDAGLNYTRVAVGGKGGRGDIGAGGLDVSTGSHVLNQLLTRAANTGQFGAGNTGFEYASQMASLIAGGPGAPNDAGVQARLAPAIMGGEATFGKMTGGSMAPLYEAKALTDAISATGGYSMASEALMKAPPGLLKAIAGGADVPEWLGGQFEGGAAEARSAAKTFMNDQARSPFVATVDELVQGKAKTLLGQVRSAEEAGGSYKDVFRGKSAAEQRKMAEILGPLTAGASAENEMGMGTLLSGLGASEGYGGLRGKGSHAVGPQGSEKSALGDQSSALADAAKTMKESLAELKILFEKLMPVARKAGRGMVHDANSTATAATAEESIGKVSTQLNTLAKNIEAVNRRIAAAGAERAR
jgi:hypothetical protein